MVPTEVRDEPKWAVENTSAYGTVRVYETHQKNIAELMAREANARFAESGRDVTSRVVPA